MTPYFKEQLGCAMTDTPEAVRLAEFAKARQTHLGSCRDACWEDEKQAWDDYDAMAALLRRIPELETARDVAVELAAQYAAERDQLRAELEKVKAPKGFQLVAVKGFDDLVFWLERCERKGHLENCFDLVEPWAAFEYRHIEVAPPTTQEGDQ